jgi:tetratricopeptide (TPR) repeat protein
MAAMIAACLFASHPAAARSVGTIPSQSDLAVVAAMLASSIAYLHHRRTGKGRALALALLFETAALGCKETAAITPLLWLVIDLGDDETIRARTSHTRFLVSLGPLIAYGLLRIALRVWPIAEPTTPHAWTVQVASFAKLIVATALRSLAPLSFVPPLHTDRPSGDLSSLLQWLSLTLCIGMATLLSFVRVPKSRLALAFLWLPALFVLAGQSHVHISDDPDALVLSDRWLLLPAYGASLLIGLGLAEALARIERAALRVLVLCALGAFVLTDGLVAMEENASFASENTRVLHLASLYRQSESPPPDAREVLLAADAIAAEGRGDDAGAIEAHRQLLAQKPEDSLRRYNLASVLFRAGQPTAALEQAHIAFHGRSLRGEPFPEDGVSRGRRRAEKALLLGLIHERLGHHDEAQRYFALSLALNPGDAVARSKLAALSASPHVNDSE